jgi:hypothetical protein
MYFINYLQSEPHHQHQNPTERRIQDLKRVSSHIMNRTGMSACYWLHSLLHLAFDELFSYNELSSIFEDQHERQANTSDATWIFNLVKNHQELYHSLILTTKAPISAANYTVEINLLDTPGWKLKHVAEVRYRLTRMIQQTKVNRPQVERFIISALFYQ